AHNLARFSQVIGSPGKALATLPTFQRKLLRVPGRITRSARQTILHLPARWPWRIAFIEALTRIRALPTLA
ncbi:MAG: transposase, partial [Thermoleophilia bacterium]|nr:transposase [Thermoleophilia bacterium]